MSLPALSSTTSYERPSLIFECLCLCHLSSSFVFPSLFLSPALALAPAFPLSRSLFERHIASFSSSSTHTMSLTCAFAFVHSKSRANVLRLGSPRVRLNANANSFACGAKRVTAVLLKSSWRDEMKNDDDAKGSRAIETTETNDKTNSEQSKAGSREDGGERALAYEPRRKRAKRTGEVRRARVDVRSSAVDAARGTGVRTAVQESEEAYVKFLFLYVNAIFVYGVTLALSAFKILPESVDEFIAGKMYPLFTPFVGVFLVFSSIYGVIKTRNDPNAK